MSAIGMPTGMLGPGQPLQSLCRSDLRPAQAHICDDENALSENKLVGLSVRMQVSERSITTVAAYEHQCPG